MSPSSAARIAELFEIEGRLVDVRPFERGHIHDTFVSRFQQPGGERRYLHQRMNEAVFPDIPALMHNIAVVTQHLRRKQVERDEGPPQTLQLVRTHEGQDFLRGESGAWRTYQFIENTESFNRCQSAQQAYSAAFAFGHFQALLRDLDIATLHETLPRFFSSPFRLQQLDAAVARDGKDRVRKVAAELDFVDARRDLAYVIDGHLKSGRFRRRPVHGDTKLNNVLFDQDSGAAVAVVDLDTCMPAYSLYDFGDLIRFTAATSDEDEVDLAKVGMDLQLYRALVAGYREATSEFLTPLEVELMPLAARLVTFTVGIRFLADFLDGDRYFKIAREDHNLDRARVQFRMVHSMEQQDRPMRAC